MINKNALNNIFNENRTTKRIGKVIEYSKGVHKLVDDSGRVFYADSSIRYKIGVYVYVESGVIIKQTGKPETAKIFEV